MTAVPELVRRIERLETEKLELVKVHICNSVHVLAILQLYRSFYLVSLSLLLVIVCSSSASGQHHQLLKFSTATEE